MAVSELKCIVAFVFVCCGQVTNTKKKIVWFISLVKLHNLEYSIELPVQNLKLSITLSLPKYKIFKLLRSLRYVYKSSCCV